MLQGRPARAVRARRDLAWANGLGWNARALPEPSAGAAAEEEPEPGWHASSEALLRGLEVTELTESPVLPVLPNLQDLPNLPEQGPETPA